MNNKRGWKTIDQALHIQWGKLAGDEPISLSARQQDADKSRALPFRTVHVTVTAYPNCDWCKMTLPPANRSRIYNGLCLDCEGALEGNE